MPVFGPPQIMFVNGKGTELWDSEGKRYLDFLGGLAVISLGHSNPAVAEAIGTQAKELMHVSNLFANPVATRAAMEIDRLLMEVTGQLGQVFFTNSGAEAIECALKLARKHGGRGRHVVVSALGQLPRAHARRRSRPPASRPSTSRSSRCRRASTTSRGATSMPSPRPSTRRSPRCSSSRCRAREASTWRRPATCRRSARSATPLAR